MSSRRGQSTMPPVDAAGETIGRAAYAIMLSLLASVIAPAIACGALLALALRARRLSWTWALAIAPVAAAPVALDVERAVDGVVDATRATGGELDPAPLVLVLAPWWLAATPVLAIAIKLYLDRRDRLHGGAVEQAARSAQGPLSLVANRRARERETAAGPYRAEGARGPAGGLLLGQTAHGRPMRLPKLVAHACIVGGSNTGKTNTAEVMLEGTVAAGGGFVVLDGKGGRDLPRAALALGRRYGRPVALWSVLPYGDPDLDALRWSWNPAGAGNATEIKDRIADAEEQTEPYYAAVAARGLLAAAQGQHAHGQALRLDDLSELLDNPQLLVDTLRAGDAERFARDIAWFESLGDSEKSGLRGMGLRLHTMVASDGGDWLLPRPDGREIDLYRAVTEGWLVVFTLPEGTYPALIPHVCRYALSALNAVGTRIEREGRRANAVVFVDELSAFDGGQLCSGLERGRSAGLSYIVATQSLSNFDSAGGAKLLHGVLDNSEVVVIHRQTVPEAAELLAGVAGTEEAWEHTHKVNDMHALRVGLTDEIGDRARRLTDRFRAHPNTIKQLPLGEAIVVTKRPAFAVEHVRIRSGLSAP